ncbi:MAG: M48 family metallopeptidase [Flavobacteriales bacterium]|nr:M48 family metallopeptidase [Flavobacteriales bacterium]MBX2959328.1 M48 family metallopeptidase [Flavobacteriales bacterium]MCL4857383.1 M48 family metallopeptidase [Flavobacteriales bacterium]HRN41125.1 M48 family metallopeptidase [Vicingus sp.]HRP59849.1 M48 family metallopeptidase [Vicingus sp.]
MKITRFSLVLLAFLTVLACNKVPISGRRQMNLLPESQLLGMSLTQYNTFLGENPPMSDQIEDTKLVRKVGNRIARAVEKYMKDNNMSNKIAGYKWEFNLVNQNVINAWCMPGGKVVVYTGILPVTKTEAGLAVVMGHEIAHAVARHGNERMSQGIVAAVGAAGLAVALKEKPAETQALFLSAYGVTTGVGMLAFGRNHESEADKLGMVFMAMAGYEPKEAIPFWERMKAASGGSGGTPEFLSTHPSHDTRIERITEWLPNAESYFVKAVD